MDLLLGDSKNWHCSCSLLRPLAQQHYDLVVLVCPPSIFAGVGKHLRAADALLLLTIRPTCRCGPWNNCRSHVGPRLNTPVYAFYSMVTGASGMHLDIISSP